jgi:ParB/RepB/Spo0J family partition protein
MKRSQAAALLAPRGDAQGARVLGWTRQDADPRPMDTFTNRDFVDIDPRRVEDDPELANERRFIPPTEMEEMIASVREHGIMQPIGVRMTGSPEDPHFVRVYGFKRHQAALRLGMERITVRNHGFMELRQAAALQWRENDDRTNPHWVDKAIRAKEMTLWFPTQAAAAEALGMDASLLSKLARLGSAIALLDPADRELLYHAAVNEQERRDIVTLEAADIATFLRERARRGEPVPRRAAPRRPSVQGELFSARPYRRGGGEFLTLRYRAADLSRNPSAALEIAEFCLGRIDLLAETLSAASDRAMPEERKEEARQAQALLESLQRAVGDVRAELAGRGFAPPASG